MNVAPNTVEWNVPSPAQVDKSGVSEKFQKREDQRSLKFYNAAQPLTRRNREAADAIEIARVKKIAAAVCTAAAAELGKPDYCA